MMNFKNITAGLLLSFSAASDALSATATPAPIRSHSETLMLVKESLVLPMALEKACQNLGVLTLDGLNMYYSLDGENADVFYLIEDKDGIVSTDLNKGITTKSCTPS